jgi:ribonucleoside-diphosphate reductase beta chain
MSDVDVAKAVDEASFGQMKSIDIEDFFTEMDVSLRRRPTARDLYVRWERQNWSSYDIDFSRDVTDWQEMPEAARQAHLLGFIGFFIGEAGVTHTLGPMVVAAPTDEDQQFLATQLVDEARHTVFFDRFFREVLGIPGLEGARAIRMRATGSDADGYGGDGARPAELNGHEGTAAYAERGSLFSTDLVEVTDDVRRNPGDYGRWLDSIVLYHMIIETMGALPGQKRIIENLRRHDQLPGFRHGFTAVTRDESRHVGYGVYAITKGVEAGYHDRIVDTTRFYLERRSRIARYRAVRPGGVGGPSFREQQSFAFEQLRKRYAIAGVAPDALGSLEEAFWGRIERDFDDYETRYGEPHPLRDESLHAMDVAGES